MTMRRDFFVTGTDTGVGKTLVSAALLRAWRRRGRSVAGMKPVASGSAVTAEGLRNDDALALQAESSRPWAYDRVNPYAFEPAIAPHIAAAEAGVEVELERIVAPFRQFRESSDTVIVEGAGGFLVPLGPRLSFADLPQALGLEVILVVGLRLGCLNHAFLTAEAVAARGLPLAGWVGNLVDPGFGRLEQNLVSLHAGLPAPCLGVIPHLPSLDLDRAVGALVGLEALDPAPSTA
jgi:dethiobiotin synthetase